MEYIDITNSGTYDFLYLRIDFQNKCKLNSPFRSVDCSVGYAFINFIDPMSIIPFAKARVGTKWSSPHPSLPYHSSLLIHGSEGGAYPRNRFHSDKICDISYANIQGKECLIEKFRNSCVMDEDPSYRPKIFHSSGPLVGQEQEFPLKLKVTLTIVFLNPIMRGGNYVPSHVLVKLVSPHFPKHHTNPLLCELAINIYRAFSAGGVEKDRSLIFLSQIFPFFSWTCGIYWNIWTGQLFFLFLLDC